jgi:hypothetical protein
VSPAKNRGARGRFRATSPKAQRSRRIVDLGMFVFVAMLPLAAALRLALPTPLTLMPGRFNDLVTFFSAMRRIFWRRALTAADRGRGVQPIFDGRGPMRRRCQSTSRHLTVLRYTQRNLALMAPTSSMRCLQHFLLETKKKEEPKDKGKKRLIFFGFPIGHQAEKIHLPRHFLNLSSYSMVRARCNKVETHKNAKKNRACGAHHKSYCFPRGRLQFARPEYMFAMPFSCKQQQMPRPNRKRGRFFQGGLSGAAKSR